MPHLLRTAAALVALVLLAAACGQKEGVHQVGFGATGRQVADATAGAVVDDGFDEPAFDDLDGDGELDAGEELGGGPVTGVGTGGGAAPAETGDATDGGGDAGGQPASGAGGQTDGSATTGGSAPPAGGSSGGDDASGGGGNGGGGNGGTGGPSGGSSAGGTQQAADPNDSRGVSATEIRIGVHAPLSGAAPLPQSSFQTGKDQYWQHVGKVVGRDVKVFVKDDGYNPSRATSVCNAMIQQDQVFILVGGGGADQIAACARTAAQQGVPYLSAGVDEGVLRSLPNYFATSMSYVQQARLLAQFIEKRHRPSDDVVGILRDRTPSFNNLVSTLAEELKKRGIDSRIVQYQNGPSSAQAMQGFETAFPIMAPSAFLQVLRSPGGANPQWVGVGITMGLNTVTGAACEGGNRYKGEFFSPFPGLNAIDSMDPGFRQAGGKDDIELALWGLNKTLHEVLKKMGEDLTRSAFVRTLETQEIRSGVYPPTKHTPTDHFGASSVHLLVADCSKGQNVTPPGGTFVSSF